MPPLPQEQSELWLTDLQNLLQSTFFHSSFHLLSSDSFGSYQKQFELLFSFLSIQNITQRNSAYKWENLNSWSCPNIRAKSFAVILCPAQTLKSAVSWNWLSKLWIRTRKSLTRLYQYIQVFLLLPASCPVGPVWIPKPVSTVVLLVCRSVTIAGILALNFFDHRSVGQPCQNMIRGSICVWLRKRNMN